MIIDLIIYATLAVGLIALLKALVGLVSFIEETLSKAK
jgi:hypothetical protein